MNRELSRLDLGLEEMKIHPGNNGPIATFKHFGLDCDMVFAQESMGTRRFIEIFPLLQFVLDNGGVAVIDEMDADIHPLLVPELFRWFYDKERNFCSRRTIQRFSTNWKRSRCFFPKSRVENPRAFMAHAKSRDCAASQV